jgi:hypothetical protein
MVGEENEKNVRREEQEEKVKEGRKGGDFV